MTWPQRFKVKIWPQVTWPPRSGWVKTGKITYHSRRLDELNTMRPSARLYLCSVRSYWQKNSVTWCDLVCPRCRLAETKMHRRNQNAPRSPPLLARHVKILTWFEWFAMKMRPKGHETSQNTVRAPIMTSRMTSLLHDLTWTVKFFLPKVVKKMPGKLCKKPEGLIQPPPPCRWACRLEAKPSMQARGQAQNQTLQNFCWAWINPRHAGYFS